MLAPGRYMQIRLFRVAIPLVAALAVSCGSDQKSTQPVTPTPPQPRRVAAEAEDLRKMLVDVASRRACDRLRGMFRPIARGGAATYVGVAWISECEAFGTGNQLTLQLAGHGWQWVSRSSEAVGASFEVDTRVLFTFSVEARGDLDMAYADETKIFTLWFTPIDRPTTTFEVKGDVDVDSEGLWASIVGGVASMVGSSPEERATDKTRKVGRESFADRFAEGIATTVDLCSGKVRSGLGHPEQGEMLGPPADVQRHSARIYPGGLHMHGPVLLPVSGVDLSAPESLDAKFVCQKDAAKLAHAFVNDEPVPDVPAAASDATCPIVHVIRAPSSLGRAIDVQYNATEVTTQLPELASCRS